MNAVNERQNIIILSYAELIAYARERGMWLIRDRRGHHQINSDLIDACVMKCYCCEHIAAYDPAASEAQQRDFLTHLHATLNAPSHPIRQRLDRICSASPDLLAVIKQEGNPSAGG